MKQRLLFSGGSVKLPGRIMFFWSVAELVVFIIYKISYFTGAKSGVASPVYRFLKSIGVGGYNWRLRFVFAVLVMCSVILMCFKLKTSHYFLGLFLYQGAFIGLALLVHLLLNFSGRPFGVLDVIVYNGLIMARCAVWGIAFYCIEGILNIEQPA